MEHCIIYAAFLVEIDCFSMDGLCLKALEYGIVDKSQFDPAMRVPVFRYME